MTDVDHVLLSRFTQIAKISSMALDCMLPKIKNKDLQTLISNQISNYDLLYKECCTLAKSHSVALPEYSFFKRCAEIICQTFENINIKVDVIIAFTSALRINTLIEIYNVESANSETINIGKHLQSMQDNNLQMLAQIKAESKL